jgi:hypothetical protein
MLLTVNACFWFSRGPIALMEDGKYPPSATSVRSPITWRIGGGRRGQRELAILHALGNFPRISMLGNGHLPGHVGHLGPGVGHLAAGTVASVTLHASNRIRRAASRIHDQGRSPATLEAVEQGDTWFHLRHLTCAGRRLARHRLRELESGHEATMAVAVCGVRGRGPGGGVVACSV